MGGTAISRHQRMRQHLFSGTHASKVALGQNFRTWQRHTMRRYLNKDQLITRINELKKEVDALKIEKGGIFYCVVLRFVCDAPILPSNHYYFLVVSFSFC